MRTRTKAGLIGIAGLLAAAGLSVAHDEDWRKIADRLPAVEGDIYRLGDRVERDGGFDALNMVCYSQFPLNTFGLGSNAGNDCWGYVSGSGREYAIMGLSNGYGFVEITDPVNATIVGTVSGPQSQWHDVKVIGDYAYGVSEAGSGIQVMDLSSIDSGSVSLVGNVQTGGHSSSHNIVANEQGGTLWIVGGNVGSGGLVHFDLSNPASPVLDGGHTASGYVHDAQVVTINPSDPQAAGYNGREIAFLAEEDAITIADVTDPNNTFVVSRLLYSNTGYTHQCWLSEDRQYLYLNDELDENRGFVSTTTTRVLDVSDLANPVFLNAFTNGNSSIDHNLYTHNGLMFSSAYRSGLRVYDINSNPTNPPEIAFFDTFPGSDDPAFNGNWSNYPYFPSGTIILSDIERGLFVLGFDIQASLLLTESVTPDTITTAGGETASIKVLENFMTLDDATVEMVLEQDGAQQIVSGTDQGNGSWSFQMPATDCDAPVTYYMRAESTGGDAYTLPSNAPASTFTAMSFDASFIDNAEADLGWTVSGTPGQLKGEWTRNVPQGNGRADPGNDSDGSGNAFLTGWDTGTTNTDVDTDSNNTPGTGTTYLTSPTLDLSSPGTVTYDYWISDVSNGPLTAEDGLFVEVSTNNGGSWNRVRTFNSAADMWISDSIDIETEIGLTSNGRVRFLAADEGAQNVVEAGMDHFLVTTVCVPLVDCAADTNGDGILDNGDIGVYVDLFLAGDLAADFNGDGFLDNGDIGAFITAFLAGC